MAQDVEYFGLPILHVTELCWDHVTHRNVGDVEGQQKRGPKRGKEISGKGNLLLDSIKIQSFIGGTFKICVLFRMYPKRKAFRSLRIFHFSSKTEYSIQKISPLFFPSYLLILKMAVFCGGFNASNQLGGIYGKKSPFQMAIPLHNLKCLSNGEDHTIFVYEDGTVLALGDDEDFTIGTPERTTYTNPENITSRISQEKIIFAHCGSFYSSYLTESGKIIICSLKRKEEPITYVHHNPIIFLSGGGRHPVAIDSEGKILIFKEDPSAQPDYVASFEAPIVDIVQTDAFIACIDVNGRTYGNGILNNGQETFCEIEFLKDTKIRRLAASEIHAFFITEDNNAFIFSDIYNEEIEDIRFHSIESVFVKSIEDDGTINKSEEENKIIQTFRNNILQIATGSSHALILTCDNQLYSYGYNNDGALLLGSQDHADPPMKISIDNQISYIDAGPLQSFVFVNQKPLIHPGLSYFNKL